MANALMQLCSLLLSVCSVSINSFLQTLVLLLQSAISFASGNFKFPNLGCVDSVASLNELDEVDGEGEACDSSQPNDVPCLDDDSFRSLYSNGYLIYEGVVIHERLKPVKHSFKYNVRYALIDLDNPPSWFISSSSKYHMSSDQARAFGNTSGSIFLMTNPTSVGYEQNPISVYYCYSNSENTPIKSDLVSCIAEVTNTPWNERVRFVFNPKEDSVPKPLHVSPFMDMESTWKISASSPGKTLKLNFIITHPRLGEFFYASLNACIMQKSKFPQLSLWFAPHKIAIGIYWEAFVLWWKKVPLKIHPKYENGDGYKAKVLQRNHNERQAKASVPTNDSAINHENDFSMKLNPKSLASSSNPAVSDRCPFTWIDAKEWPWK